jgi:hypothetical protein
MNNQGWICPKCGRVWSPITPSCFPCNESQKTGEIYPTRSNPPNTVTIGDFPGVSTVVPFEYNPFANMVVGKWTIRYG